MVRQTTIVSIFLASPSDVAPERRLVERTIQRWNAIRGRTVGCTLELLTWESSTSSALGTDGQDVVNQQIGDNYDAMIALFWSKLGLKTPRSMSGSVEEYERALDRKKTDPELQIGVYFKNADIPFSQIDPDQIKGVLELKSRIEKDGIFHKSFTDDDTLSFEIDVFLERIVSELKTKSLEKLSSSEITMPYTDIDAQDSPPPAEEDVGYLDILESLEKHSERTTEFLVLTGESLDRISDVVSKSGARFTELAELGNPRSSDMRKIIDEVSNVFDEFSGCIENGIADFTDSTSGIANETINLVRVSVDFDPDADQIHKAKEDLLSLYENMTGAIRGMGEFASTVRGLQRMTTSFNHSKKRAYDNVNKMISAISSSQTIIGQAIGLLE